MITITLQNFEQVKAILKILSEDKDYDFEIQIVNENLVKEQIGSDNKPMFDNKPMKAQVGFENGATLRHMLANLNK